MRVSAILAAAAILLAACGKKAEETTPPPADGGMTNATAPTGTTHTVEMIESKFAPTTLEIKAGDIVVFKNVSGGMHNVQFVKDSIPAGAEAVLEANMADKMAPLTSPMVNASETITVSFKDAPVGTYAVTCVPHIGNKMNMTITVK